MNLSLLRTRWAAVGAAVAVTLGAGGIGLAHAVKDAGERSIYTPIEACRLLDTRAAEGIGGRTTPLGAGEIITVDVLNGDDECGALPAGITGVQLNATALFASGLTHLTFWAEGDLPNASSLNPAPGQPPTPNAVTTEVASDGSFQVRNNSGSVDLLIDLVGVYEDHHHDDRYYEKGEVDTAVAAAASTSAFASDDGIVPIAVVQAPTDTTVISVTIDTPGETGSVLVNASGRLFNNLTTFTARCSLTTGESVDSGDFQGVTVPTSTTAPFAATHAFDVGAVDSLTVNLVCDRVNGTGGGMHDTWITATYVPG
jgi:hypothetical protein